MLIFYFHNFQRGFEVLNAIFQASVYGTIVTVLVYYIIHYCPAKTSDILLVRKYPHLAEQTLFIYLLIHKHH